MVNLINARLGLATNSSSSHSMILWKEKPTTDEYHEFGWQYFTAADKQSKSNYFGINLFNLLRYKMDEWVAKVVVDEITGHDLNWEDVGYVDHQSAWDFPFKFDGSGIDFSFVKDFYEWLIKSNVAILGGNDNGGDEHPLLDGSEFKYPLSDYYGNGNLICRWDKKYEFWTIFNRATGARIMMRFDENAPLLAEKVTRASTPMLVDISITDYCPYNCSFCYRGSHTGGSSAKYNDILNIINMLRHMEVFEVAIGGGEPTLHPDFVKILRGFREVGIVPNFTTKNKNWLKYPDFARDIMSYAGAFAVSVESANEIYELGELISKCGISPSRVKVHVVMGTVPESSLKLMADACKETKIGLTLLGYKDDGRGASSKKTLYYEYKDWFIGFLEYLAKKYIRVSVDTPLAKQFSKEFVSKMGIPDWMYHTEEGAFSMFIDAVSNSAAKSSFNESPLVEFDNKPFYHEFDTNNPLIKIFEGFKNENDI